MSEKYDLKAAQHEFAALAEKIAENHGVFFDHITFVWSDRSTIAKDDRFIASIHSSISSGCGG